MQEYKNLKEIIELCEEELNNDAKNVAATLDLIDLKELRNLINRNKELEKHISFYEKNGSYKARIIELEEESEKQKQQISNLETAGQALEKVYKAEIEKKDKKIEFLEEWNTFYKKELGERNKKAHEVLAKS